MTSIRLITLQEQLRQREIRESLKLRQRPTGEWEVYTVIHGSDLFRWFMISESKANWYKQHFPSIEIVKFTGD